MIIYPLIVFLATTLGALSGVGGGIVIKPAFDSIGQDSASLIGSYATVSVFFMCLTALYRQYKTGMTVNKSYLVYLAVGSLLGGIMGEAMFKQLTQDLLNQTVLVIQSSLLLLVLMTVLILTILSHRLPSYQLQHPFAIGLVGLSVGTLSVFLGIGGGPLNIVVLVRLFSLTTKEATPYSLGMIFFAQLPKLLSLLIVPPQHLNWAVIPILILAAILGGTVGTVLNRAFSEQQVKRTYSLMMIGLVFLSTYNIIHYLS